MKAFLAICFFVIPITTTTTSTVAGAQAGRRVWIGESRIEADDGSVVIPLMIDDIGEVVAGDIDLLILGEVIGGIDVRRTELLNGFLLLHNVVGDTLKISFASLQPNTGSGVFAEVVLDAAQTPPAFTIISASLNGDEIAVRYQEATSVLRSEEQATQVPEATLMAYPNPFNSEVRIALGSSLGQGAELKIYNSQGQMIRQFVDDGAGVINWDGTDRDNRSLASGLYLARSQGASKSVVSVRLTLLK